MAYITGSVDNSASPAVGIREALEAELGLVGFTLADEWGSGTAQHMRLWQSPSTAYEGGATPRSAQWYFAIQVVNATTIYTGACEAINATGDTMTAYAAAGSRSAPANADGTINEPASGYLSQGYMAMWTGGAFSTTTEPYWFIVTPQCVVGTTGLSSYALYAGYYEPFKPGIANHIPLCVLSHTGVLSGGSTSYGGLSRLPEMAGTDFGNYLWHAGVNYSTAFAPFDQGASPDTPHPLYTNLSLGGKLVVTNAASTTPVDAIERARGTTRFLRHITIRTTANIAKGDSVTDGTDTYICVDPNYDIWMKTTNLGST